VTESQMSRVFGPLIIGNAVVWAATTLGIAVATKASDDFIWVLLVLIVGSSLSGTVIESARRRSQSLEPAGPAGPSR
jgi:hypothetical protein